jgi:amidophosphoribosyltransferase
MSHEGPPIDPASHTITKEFAVIDESEQKLQHNCGIVGFDYNQPASIDEMMISLSRLQHRGEEGSGILVIRTQQDEAAVTWSTNKLLANLGKDTSYERAYGETKGKVRLGIGHNRYSTSGVTNEEADVTSTDQLHLISQAKTDIKNARQPFYSHDLVTAHNGTLTNPRLLRGYSKESSSDSAVLHDTIRRNESETLDDKIKSTLPEVEGAFSLILADPQQQALYGIRDPWGIRPLFLGKLKNDNGYMFASEPVAMANLVEDTDISEIEPGQGIKIQNEVAEEFYRDPREVKKAACIFESLYFSRPNSTMFGMNSGEFRSALGAALARQDYEDGVDFDVVVPVPRSGLKAAEGYINEMNTLQHTAFTFGIERNDSSEEFKGRTFIANGDRKEKVRRKFIINKQAVQGKKVIKIDDTLVRGTTSQVLTEMSREAGAQEVHWGFPAPPVKYPCYWGIDFPDKDELAAVGKTDEEIAESIGADSVRFLPIETMLDVAESLCGHRDFCTHCFSGEAPMAVNTEYMILKEDIKRPQSIDTYYPDKH